MHNKKESISKNGGLVRFRDPQLKKSSTQVDVETKGEIVVLSPEYDFDDLIQIYEVDSTAKKCIDLIAGSVIAGGYSFVMDGDKTEGEADEEANIKRLYEIFDNINPEKTFLSLIKDVIIDLETTGNGSLEISRGADKKVAQMYNIPISKMRVMKGDDMKFKSGQRFVENYLGTGESVKYNKYYAEEIMRNPALGVLSGYDPELNGNGKKTNEVLWLKLPNPKSRYYGLSPSVTLLRTYLTTRYCKDYNNNEFENGMLNKFAIIAKNGNITQESIETIQEYLKEVTGGGQWSTVPILNIKGNDADLKIEKLSSENKDGSYLGLLKFNREEVYVAFGVPPILLGITENATQANQDSQEKKFYENEIKPIRTELEYIFTRMIQKDFGFTNLRFQRNVTEKKDMALTNTVAETGQKSGRLSINDAREMLGMGRLEDEGADERFVYTPSGLINVKELATLTNEATMTAQAKGQGEVIVENLLRLTDRIRKRNEDMHIMTGTDDKKFASDPYPPIPQETSVH